MEKNKKISLERIIEDTKIAQTMNVEHFDSGLAYVTLINERNAGYGFTATSELASHIASAAVEFGMSGDLLGRPVVNLRADPSMTRPDPTKY